MNTDRLYRRFLYVLVVPLTRVDRVYYIAAVKFTLKIFLSMVKNYIIINNYRVIPYKRVRYVPIRTKNDLLYLAYFSP